jgi:flagellar biogenesis protein FliO
MQIMVLHDKATPRKAALPGWLLFGVLGLLMAVGSIFPPQGLRGHEAAPEPTPATQPEPPAADILDYNPPDMPEMPSPRVIFLCLGLGTVFILVSSMLTLWIGNRRIRPPIILTGQSKQLRILETLPLDGRSSVYLLQVGQTRILAGLDRTGLKSLLPLPPSFDSTLADLDEAKDADSAEAA